MCRLRHGCSVRRKKSWIEIFVSTSHQHQPPTDNNNCQHLMLKRASTHYSEPATRFSQSSTTRDRSMGWRRRVGLISWICNRAIRGPEESAEILGPRRFRSMEEWSISHYWMHRRGIENLETIMARYGLFCSFSLHSLYSRRFNLVFYLLDLKQDGAQRGTYEVTGLGFWSSILQGRWCR